MYKNIPLLLAVTGGMKLSNPLKKETLINDINFLRMKHNEILIKITYEYNNALSRWIKVKHYVVL